MNLRIMVKIMVDGYFIRSLLLAFFFKLYPEIIEDGRLYVAEPPLYRVDDKKDPFVINNNDYINRYMKAASKDYKMGYQKIKDHSNVQFLDKSEWKEFLNDTAYYVSDMMQMVKRYKINDRLLEMLLEEFASMPIDATNDNIEQMMNAFNINKFMNRITAEFNELWYDDKNALIKGAIDGKSQSLEVSDHKIRRALPIIQIMKKWMPAKGDQLILRSVKTGSEHNMSLLGILKILGKYQPNILHRFKGLGENDKEDLRITVMDPNSRSLLKVCINDIQNDAEIFQMLRGGTSQDLLGRKTLARSFRADRTLIDT